MKLPEVLLAHGERVTLASFGSEWLFLLVPLAGLSAITLWLLATGQAPRASGPINVAVKRIGSSLERVTGLPAWCAAGLGLGAWSLLVAVIGFLWDVSWHIDFGRDEFLFTPSHTMILVGLTSIIATALITILFATLFKAESGLRRGSLRLPYGAVALGALGLGAVAGFPLDELWHRNYGVDVTMWGPTHLLMISGASFTPLALWLLLREAGPDCGRPSLARAVKVFLAAAVVVGLSTFQAEFDFGVPQFQQLYHPVLIAAATGIGLVVARTALGRGGAVIAAAGFVVIRTLLALTLGPGLNQTVPRFPLYLGAALAVEGAAAMARNLPPLAAAIVTGILVGTVGLASEWTWMQVWGRHPWGPSLFPAIVIAAVVAVGAAVIGTAVGRILSFRTAGIRAGSIALAGTTLVIGLVLPLPRSDAPFEATVRTQPATQDSVDLTVKLQPVDAAESSDLFEVMSWQGGALVITSLEQHGPGRYRAERPVPVGGDWKSMVRLARKDVMVAVPVYMPADPVIGAKEIPVVPVRDSSFRRDTELLMREAHEGAAWPAVVAYGAILVVALGWIGTLTFAFVRVGRMSPRELAGSRIVVTGASDGIGAAAMVTLKEHGAHVVGIDLQPATDVVQADVRDAQAMSHAMHICAQRLGGIDILVNNAGIGRAQDAGAFPTEEAHAVVDVNFFGAWNATAAAMPHLLDAHGHVINVASGLAFVDLPFGAAYSASKRALSAYSAALRIEYRGRITVSTVYPGYIRTSIHNAPNAAGVSLEGLIRADTMNGAVDAIVRACCQRPRSLTTSWLSAVELWAARRFPRLTEATIARRVARWARTRPVPNFVRYADSGTWGMTGGTRD